MEGRAPEKRAEEGRDADDGTTANKTAITRGSERETERQVEKSANGIRGRGREREGGGGERRRRQSFAQSPFVLSLSVGWSSERRHQMISHFFPFECLAEREWQRQAALLSLSRARLFHSE